jgi:hypothetical protein
MFVLLDVPAVQRSLPLDAGMHGQISLIWLDILLLRVNSGPALARTGLDSYFDILRVPAGMLATGAKLPVAIASARL